MNDPQSHSLPVRLAVDIGGTTLKAALFHDNGVIAEQLTVPTITTDRDALTGLQTVIQCLMEAASAAGHRVSGIGIASPGAVHARQGVIEKAVNLAWTDLPLQRIIEAKYGIPVQLEHDARAGAIAERHAHPDERTDYEDFIFVPIGTGVAAAITAGGALIRGATNAAGEFAHVSISPLGQVCACGQRGCIEAYASAASVMTRYRARGGTAAATTPDLARSIDYDGDARAVWDDLVEALANGLISMTAALDPAVIVIGGGLSQAGEILMAPLRLAMASKLSWRPTPRIVQSRLGSHAGLIGAAIIARPGTVSDNFASNAMVGSEPSASRTTVDTDGP